MRNRLVLIAIVALAWGCSGPTPEPSQPPAETPLYLFLLAGQSNMAGRGEVEEIDRTPHPRVFALDSQMKWGPAHEPLHFDKPNIVGVGPGFAFGRALAERFPDVRIGLIPAAVGGSSIRVWVPHAIHESTGAYPWDDARYRAWRVLALTGGELKGVIWHQGESDAGDFTEQYPDAIVDLVERLRDEFQSPTLPFVAGELAPFFVDSREGGDRINEALRELPSRLEHTAVVAAEGSTARADGIHFDSASSRRLGERYAEAMAKLLSAE